MNSESAVNVIRVHGRPFCEALNGSLTNNDFGYWWRKAAKAAGVPAMRYHDLRHAFASMLISAGCSVKAVQHALGHASAATTLNIYSHMWPGDDEVIRQAVDRALTQPAEDSLRTEEQR